MLRRKELFPNVVEINHQAGQILGCNVYLVFAKDAWILIDIGYEDTVEEIVEMIRELDFPHSQCQTLIATHADVDHVQGLSKAKRLLRSTITAHPLAAKPLEQGDRLVTFAEIQAQGIDMVMPPVKVDHLVNDGDTIKVGDIELEVWLTPGHTDSQLSFRLRDLLFSGDNIYRDGCVGAIDAHPSRKMTLFLTQPARLKIRMSFSESGSSDRSSIKLALSVSHILNLFWHSDCLDGACVSAIAIRNGHGRLNVADGSSLKKVR